MRLIRLRIFSLNSLERIGKKSKYESPQLVFLGDSLHVFCLFLAMIAGFYVLEIIQYYFLSTKCKGLSS